MLAVNPLSMPEVPRVQCEMLVEASLVVAHKKVTKLCRWSAVDRAQRLRDRHASETDWEEDNQGSVLLPGIVDPITLQRVASPAASPSGHVMGMATWAAVLATTGHCPFTQQPLRREQASTLLKT